MSDDKPIDRRRFFRSGLAELLKPLSKAVRPLEALANEIGKLEDPIPPSIKFPQIRRAQNVVAQHTPAYDDAQSEVAAEAEYWVRPPGALPEQQFLETCSRCGECVRACPVHAIRLQPSGIAGDGAPYIDIETQPCAMCESLECMHRCPTGALVQIGRDQIEMGTASWHEERCVRPSGGSCSICVDHCPVGAAAIELDGNRVLVHETGCTGCGVCQHDCPTWPKSITVTPKAKLLADARDVNAD
jgi:ferredoxin-type protein NapG